MPAPSYSPQNLTAINVNSPSKINHHDINKSTIANSQTSMPANKVSVPQNLDSKIPLRASVKNAVNLYLQELDGQMPRNLYETLLHEIEKPLFEVVLEQTHGNQSKAALMLGISRGTLRKKMLLYNLM